MPFTEEQLTISGRAGALTAVLHRADNARAAALFCHPFAEEKKSSHRSFVDIARALAKEDIASLRFDMTGCGDSAGDFGDADISTWLADIRSAADELAKIYPEVPRVIIGMRLGATLAAASSQQLKPDGLALIEPVMNGGSYFSAELRRTLIKQMMTDGASSSSRKELTEQLERGEGKIDFDGYTITGALYSELIKLDLAQMEIGTGKIFIMQISPTAKVSPPVQSLADRLSGAGAEAAAEALAMPPVWNRIDAIDNAPLVEPIVRWVKEAF